MYKIQVVGKMFILFYCVCGNVINEKVLCNGSLDDCDVTLCLGDLITHIGMFKVS